MTFLGYFIQYLLAFVFLVAVAGLGIFTGKKWSDSKKAKKK
ncbi:MAG: vanadium nitrogenase [Clostridiales bacterium]|nr:vanadium nitrogenase [Clostridiales bacterium]